MSKSTYWECDPVIFFRLAQQSEGLLATLQWSNTIRSKLDELFTVHVREDRQAQRIQSLSHLVDAPTWRDISRWLEHAHLRKEINMPHILSKYNILYDTIYQLIRSRHAAQALQGELLTLLQDDFSRMWEAALLLLADSALQTTLAYTSWDFRLALEDAIDRPERTPAKKRRDFLQTLSNYLARGAVKTCPLGLLCGTAIARFAESQTENPIKIAPGFYTTVAPGRALLDSLITHTINTLPLEQVGAVHLNVSASVESGKLLFWQAQKEGGLLVEQLQAIKIDQIIATVLARCGENSILLSDLLDHLCEANPGLNRNILRNALQRLLSLRLLCTESHLTAFSQDTLQDTLLIIQDLMQKPAEQSGRWLSAIKEIADCSEPFQDTLTFNQTSEKLFPSLLTTLHPIGKEVLEDTRSPSTILSVDSYARIDSLVPADIRPAIEHAASLSALLAGAAYPDSHEFASRQRFLAAFRSAHGDDKPVSASETLNTHWQLLDSILGQVMKPDYQRISPVSTQTWPQPLNPSSPYGQIYQQFVSHLTSDATQHQRSIHLDASLLREVAATQPRRAIAVDVVCRVAAQTDLPPDHLHEVHIEAVTLPGRLTYRHWNTLARLGEQESCLVDDYRSRFREDQTACFETPVLAVEALATSLSSRDQNVDRRSEMPPVVLALTEPLRLSDFQRVLRFKDIYFRYDTLADRIVTTLGPHGEEIVITYVSPLSPSYNRRLHLLRYIALMGHPVLVAPKWFLPEASQQCHFPRLCLDNLVVTPERWVFPLQYIRSALASHQRTRRYLDLHVWRKRHSLPDKCFAYTNRQTKPLFIDFYSPFGLQNILGLVSQEAETILFEECYPDSDQQLLRRGSEPVFNSIIATMRQQASA
jgi:hypothetical protein